MVILVDDTIILEDVTIIRADVTVFKNCKIIHTLRSIQHMERRFVNIPLIFSPKLF